MSRVGFLDDVFTDDDDDDNEQSASTSVVAATLSKPGLANRVVRGTANVLRKVGSGIVNTVRGSRNDLTDLNNDDDDGETSGSERTSPSYFKRSAPAAKSASGKEEASRQAVNDALRCHEHEFVEPLELSVVVATWNVNKQEPPKADLSRWLFGGKKPPPADVSPEASSSVPPSTVSTPLLRPSLDGSAFGTPPIPPPLPHPPPPTEADLPDVVVVGLQEAATGSSAAALLMEVTTAYAEWKEAVVDTLNAGARSAGTRHRYRCVAAVQLVGLILIFVVRSDHVNEVRNIRKAVTRTGPMAVVGNKGAVAVRATIYSKRFLFVSAHFAAHDHQVAKRNQNYFDCLASLVLDLPEAADDELDNTVLHIPCSPKGRPKGVSGLRWADRFLRGRRQRGGRRASLSKGEQLLEAHDYVFFFGDLNYRLDDRMNMRQIRERLSLEQYGQMMVHDELRQGMAANTIFHRFDESPVLFGPTYKFDPGTNQFDTSKKQRKAGYTDRILYRVLDDFDGDSSGGETDDDEEARQQNESQVQQKEKLATPPPEATDGLGGDAMIPNRSQSPSSSTSPPQKAAHVDPSLVEFGAIASASASLEGPAMIHKSPSRAAMHRRRDSMASNTSSARGEKKKGLSCIRNVVKCQEYTSIPELNQSDHRPVTARFRVEAVRLIEEALGRVLFKLRQDMNIESLFEDDLEASTIW